MKFLGLDNTTLRSCLWSRSSRFVESLAGRGSSDEVCGSLATPDPVFGTEDPLVAGAGAEDAVADTLSSPRGDKLEVGAEA